jgi:iron complex outermembrane recepter protein
LNEKISRTERVSFYFPDFDGITEIAFALAFGGTPATPAGGISNAITRSRNTNYGIFAEATYNLSDAFSINAGARYAHDKKKFTAQRFGDSFDDPVVPGGFITTDSVSSHAWLPSITLAYRPNDSVNIFGRIERGYKAGGYTGEGAGNPLDAIVSFKPEFALSYELGGKFQFLDRKLRVNVTGFFTKYDDLQTQQFLQLDPTRPPDNFVVNAVNGAEAKGVELDVLARPAKGISFYGNYAYTKCEFTGTLFISQGVDIDGNTCRRTPKNAFAVGADLRQDVREGVAAVLGADLQHTSSYFFENTNSPLTANPSETTLNAYAGIETDGGIKVRAWVKNLTNKRKFADKLELFGTVYANYQPPRTIGVTVGYSFGGN